MMMATQTFEKPGPGSWAIDRSHCDRPRVRFLHGMEEAYADGFRNGFRKYGMLLDTIELAHVHGFPYMCIRPVGAPPEPKGTPPKLVFKLLTWLHPEIRRRNRRAEEVFATKAWKHDVAEFHDEFFPWLKDRLGALQAVALGELSDEDLLRHVDEVCEVMQRSFHHHFSLSPSYMVVVGDFMAHAAAWTGANTLEVLEVFRGASPHSVDGPELVAAVVAALREDSVARAAVEADGDPGAVLASLREHEGEVGRATRAWLDVVGQRIFTGYDLDALTGLEAPGALIKCLRARLDKPAGSDRAAKGKAALARLRARVPAEHHETFDELFESAREIYGLRDAHSSACEAWTLGVVRVAALEAGRRLVERDLVAAAEHVLELSQSELRALFVDGNGPSPEQIVARWKARTDLRAAEAPDVLGPPPGDPPPTDWLPPAAARLQRAADAYLAAMFGEREATDKAPDAEVVRGLGASPGTYVGTARIIDGPEDFTRLQPGDVLVATITTPAYNVLLPLLGGVVTDRGGLLSHPAIVTREYGIPGVVGTLNATKKIPDGARVEIDGTAGTVRVLR